MGKEISLWAECRVCMAEFGGVATFNSERELEANCELAKASKEHEDKKHGHNVADVYTLRNGGEYVGVVVSASETKTYFEWEKSRYLVK